MTMIFHTTSRTARTRITRTRGRRGVLLAELIIAFGVLGVAATVLMAVVLSVSAQRAAAEQRQFALIHAENVLDALLATPWPEATAEGLSQQLESRTADLPARPQLVDLKRTVTVTDEPDDSARQITLELRWRDRHGEWAAPLRLSAWYFAPAEATP